MGASRSRLLPPVVLVLILALSATVLVAPNGLRATAAPPSSSVPPAAHSPSPSKAGWAISARTPNVPGRLPSHELADLSRYSASCGSTYVQSPAWMAWDSVNDTFWVADGDGCVDLVVPPTSGLGYGLNASVPVGVDPFAVAVDNRTNEVFVSNNGSRNVTVVSAVSDSVVANLTVGSEPQGIAYDSRSGDVFVANHGSDNVSVINGTTLSVVASVDVGTAPVGVTADPTDGRVFVDNSGSSNVSVIDDTTLHVIASVGTGLGTYASTWDPATDTIYATNPGDSNVSAIYALTATVTASIPVPGPGGGGILQGLAYDSANETLWVGGGWGFLAVLNATTNSAIAYSESDPSGVGYDPHDNVVCVTNTGNVTFECFVMPAPSYYAGTSIVSTVTVNETGLPNGTSWSANTAIGYSDAASGTSSTASIVFGQGSTYYCWGTGFGTGNLTVSNVGGFVPSPGSTPLDLCGVSHTWVNVTFRPAVASYPVYVNESGLPAGGTWTAWVTGASTSGSNASLQLRLGNGTYTLSIPAAGVFGATPSSVALTVNGAPAAVTVQFAEAGYASYTVGFLESGLPPGTSWGISTFGPQGLSATTGAASVLRLSLPNGSYTYHAHALGYSPSPWTGNLNVSGGPVNVSVLFVQATFQLSFQERGLPNGTSWTVAIAGQSTSTGVGARVFRESNGTYAYTVAAVGTDYPAPSAGNVTVSGANVTVNVTFGSFSYPVAFVEQGLPSGTSWSIGWAGNVTYSAGSTILLYATNGTYPYTIGSVADYHSRTNGTAKVQGSPITVVVGFALDRFELRFQETGLPSGTGWAVIIGSSVRSGLVANLTFDEPNGSYGYVVLGVLGYVTTSSGVAIVNGSSTNVTVAFRPETYPIVFVEFGLPAGSNWSVTVSNVSRGFSLTQSTTSNALTIFLANGTYAVNFTLPAGVTSNVSSTQVTVDGRPTTGATVHAAPAPAAPGTEMPSSRPTPWAEVALGAALGAVGGGTGAALVVRSRQRARPPAG